MKIVIATPFYPPQVGILATYAAGIEGALTRAGHTVVVARGERGLPLLSHFLFFCRIFFELKGASCVFALDTWSVGMPAFFAARLRGTPYLVRIGGDHLWEHYIERTGRSVRFSDFYTSVRDHSRTERIVFWFYRTMTKRAARLFFNSRFQRDIWERAYELGNRSSILENYYPPRLETAAPERKVFVSANRAARYKNDAQLRAVFAKVKARHPDIELDTRTLPHEEQLARLAGAYAVIIPSISEIQSNTAIEAVVRGRPFIMTDNTGSKERLGDCGLFVDTRSPAALQGALEEILRPERYAALAEKAQAFSFTHSWEDLAREILAVLK